jgi:uncharacterized membrane protein YoaK (UPF0700 family)
MTTQSFIGYATLVAANFLFFVGTVVSYICTRRGDKESLRTYSCLFFLLAIVFFLLGFCLGVGV